MVTSCHHSAASHGEQYYKLKEVLHKRMRARCDEFAEREAGLLRDRAGAYSVEVCTCSAIAYRKCEMKRNGGRTPNSSVVEPVTGLSYPAKRNQRGVYSTVEKSTYDWAPDKAKFLWQFEMPESINKSQIKKVKFPTFTTAS
jgi:hypothetical protein